MSDFGFSHFADKSPKSQTHKYKDTITGRHTCTIQVEGRHIHTHTASPSLSLRHTASSQVDQRERWHTFSAIQTAWCNTRPSHKTRASGWSYVATLKHNYPPFLLPQHISHSPSPKPSTIPLSIHSSFTPSILHSIYLFLYLLSHPSMQPLLS